ncbi:MULTISPECIES: LysR family transcriptional regulator [unclassified Comamonas]|uniref:LysR family transcriptional regulator n=1 Tax=unclassified Comamonas TaxID=2638500 RepID=UPI001FA717FE|nr:MULTISPECIES: LysR family transcriptional regulator [unclassified Comamonas]UNV90747.1 LysR substrate-binding domain-containing protein [Comamonas sp. 7D-2evo1]UNV95653.1 LysR substrate-binding domain-containing protein [Comamonas sp. 7D-2]UNW00386.1 LysR substrate-binding domain-containing protein [Comamonas sp. 7D-2evo2]
MKNTLGPQTPTLRQLELFLSLSGSDGIAGAGAKIGMTPSATSHVLRSLESALGTSLIDRNASTVELTHAGKQILPHVRDLFAAMHLIQSTATASAGLHSGVLRIGSFGASSSLKLLPPLLEAFRRRHPGIEVYVTEKPDAAIEQDLIERKIEIGVVTLPKARFDTLPLAIDELVAVLPAEHELAKDETVGLKALAAYPLILTHAGSQSLVARMFEKAGVHAHVTHELSQLLSILGFVASGQGVSVVASLALPEQYPGVVYRRITSGLSRRVGLACLNDRRLSPAASALWQQAQAGAMKKLRNVAPGSR